jgi:hypothetical protein
MAGSHGEGSPEARLRLLLAAIGDLDVATFVAKLKDIARAFEARPFVHAMLDAALKHPQHCERYLNVFLHPDFPLSESTASPRDGSSARRDLRPLRRWLLETLQDRFERHVVTIKDIARQETEAREGAPELRRSMGRIYERLRASIVYIGHCFLRGIAAEKVVGVVFYDLVGPQLKAPHEKMLLCALELVNIVGGSLRQIPLTAFMCRLTQLQRQRSQSDDAWLYASNVRFLVQDVLELNDLNWKRDLLSPHYPVPLAFARASDEELLRRLSVDGLSLRCVPAPRRSRQLVLCAVLGHGLALRFAPNMLRRAKELVSYAVRSSGHALRFAAPELRGDRDVVLEAIRNEAAAFMWATQSLQNDRDFVLRAVQERGLALQFASRHLRRDREVVRAAVQTHGEAFEFAAPWLQADRDLAYLALQSSAPAVRHSSAELLADREFMLMAVGCHGATLQYASRQLQGDRELVGSAVEQAGAALRFAASACQAEREIVERAVAQDGRALRFASDALRACQHLVRLAVRRDGNALQFAADALKANSRLVIEACQSCPEALRHAAPELSRAPVDAKFVDNPFAAEGASCPVVSLVEVEHLTEGLLFTACFGLSGDCCAKVPIVRTWPRP